MAAVTSPHSDCGIHSRRHAPAHGSTTAAPVVSKSVTFGVTTVIQSTLAVAAAYYAMVEVLEEVIGGCWRRLNAPVSTITRRL